MKDVTLDSKIFNDTQMNVNKGKKKIKTIYIYGKNGTGKSTISELIKEQNSDEYDVRLFNGFESIIRNDNQLNSITLGEKNVSIQKEIDVHIDQKNKQTEKCNSLSEDLKNCESKINSVDASLKRLYKTSAKSIKIDLNIMNYDKRDFENDIPYAKKLDESDIRVYKETLNTKTLAKKEYIPIFIDIKNILEEVNKLLQTSIVKNSVNITFNSNKEENWVNQGIELHKEYDKCIFCGNNISTKRWTSLTNYFNNEVNNLSNRIYSIEKKIKEQIEYINRIEKYDESAFYPKFKSDLIKINHQIFIFKMSSKEILSDILRKLEEKKNAIFSQIMIYKPQQEFPNINKLNNSINELINENNKFGENIKDEKHTAKEALKYDEVYNKLFESNYNELKYNEKSFSTEYDKICSNYRDAKSSLDKINEEIINLESKTISEEIAVSNINEKLNLCGNNSFKLINVKNDKQKGRYIVKDINNNETREIDKLSTGEKNIVAFLWFINSLKDVLNTSSKEKIIIFDDPMNSNDDTYQYLIISEIEQLLYETKNDMDIQKIFVLTHNVHFYVNITEHKNKSKHMIYHLNSSKGKTSLKEIDEDKDIKSRYDSLWDDIKWLYDQNQPDLMLNPIRRMLETYFSFNKLNFSKEIMKNNFPFYEQLNVSSHSLDDELTNINTASCDDVKERLENLFKKCNGEEHFNNRWNNKQE